MAHAMVNEARQVPGRVGRLVGMDDLEGGGVGRLYCRPTDSWPNDAEDIIALTMRYHFLRILSLNIGTMTGKSRELAEMLDRRRIDIACVQETKWKGSKAREIGDGYKLFYHGEKTSRNGVGIIISHKWKDNILAVNRMSDRLMSMQLVIKKGRLHVISAYAPQVGCTDQEKDSFWEGLDEVLQQIPDTEQVILAGDLNGHIGASRE